MTDETITNITIKLQNAYLIQRTYEIQLQKYEITSEDMRGFVLIKKALFGSVKYIQHCLHVCVIIPSKISKLNKMCRIAQNVYCVYTPPFSM